LVTIKLTDEFLYLKAVNDFADEIGNLVGDLSAGCGYGRRI
jgi:hypothetical protein